MIGARGFLGKQFGGKNKRECCCRGWGKVWVLRYETRKQMLLQEKIQNFGYMRNLSKLERISLKYIELRKLFNFEKSVFLYKENYLLFCYCDTSKNDRDILLWMSLDERNVRLNIKE